MLSFSVWLKVERHLLASARYAVRLLVLAPGFGDWQLGQLQRNTDGVFVQVRQLRIVAAPVVGAAWESS
jgi:hypothetical protein